MAVKGTFVPLATWTVASKQLPVPPTRVMVQRVLTVLGVVISTVPVGTPIPGNTAATDVTLNSMVWPETNEPGPEAGDTVKPATAEAALPTVRESEPIDAAYQMSLG